MKKSLSILLMASLLISFSPQKSYGSDAKEFIMACAYGVLTGTLVGAATLAFTEQPGENLSRVARGASMGLYLGIALGAYVVYVVPNQLEEPTDLYQEPALPTEEEARVNFGIFPLVTQRGVEGVAAQWKVMSW